MSRTFLASLSPLALLLASCSHAAAGDSASERTGQETLAGLQFDDMATFDEPWAMAFLPGTPYALVTEKKGVLKLWQAGHPARDVTGVPHVDYGGQGGLGDVQPSPHFAQDHTIYLSWAEAGPNDTRGAAVGSARLELDGANPRLDGLNILWRQAPKTTGYGQYAHRITFSPDGKYLFISSGERQKKTPAQDLSGNLGKIVRLNLDGSPAAGNPFARKGGVTAQIWSLGHRNPLGLRFDLVGRLWDIEHGPRGGDELNLVKPGRNYGWPLVSNGDDYDGRPIPRHSTRPDLAAPAISWTPVIGPGDMIFVSSDKFPSWRNNALVAGLVCQCLVRVAFDGARAREVERIPMGARMREVAQGPDGAIWVLEDGEDARMRRIEPKSAN
ncbi:MAG: PQQ-dependent sugar dehydrogenase [Sphingomonadales bacterium]|nr:PQQ-dependent sugar dehydrogenase [Sphingomonadales bacterium]MDE2569232.1 PQQ-dependent sugar dehydrogenase [Sphingomonadales bacterium]